RPQRCRPTPTTREERSVTDDGDRQLRTKAGFAVAHALGSEETRQLLEQHGHQSDDHIVIALGSDRIADVIARASSHDRPAVVAVYWPATERLEFASLTSFDPGGRDQAETWLGQVASRRARVAE